MPIPKSITVRANESLAAAFTAMRPGLDPDKIVPGSTEARDQMRESDWFPIFRSGKYPQGNFSKADVDEIAEEWAMSGRRAPLTFDHLTPADMDQNAKPGSAAGFLVELRAADETDPRYAGERIVEARFKVNWMARYATQEGAFRNCSIGLAYFVGRDGKKRLGIHHLALLGAAPAGVDALPEVIFSQASAGEGLTVLSFSQMDAMASAPTTKEPDVSVIAFADHHAALDKQKAEIEARFTAELETANEATAAAEAAATEAKAELETVKTELETAKTDAAAAKTETETVKAEAAIALEEGKQAADKSGYERGLLDGERRFNEQREKDEVAAFCVALFQAGKLTEQESKDMPATILAMPSGEHRERFRSVLSGRAGLSAAGSTFSAPPQDGGGSEELTDDVALAKAQELMRAEPTKFSGIVDAVLHVRRTHKKEST